INFLNKNCQQLCEITCIWMSKSFKLSNLEKFLIYSLSLVESIKTGKLYVLGGTNNPKILKIQIKILPHMIWSGIKDNANYKVWVYYGLNYLTIPRILFWGLPLELLIRFKKNLASKSFSSEQISLSKSIK
ncbi:MAG: hypothetical protein KDD45_10035, partial [Bdellovibrionales bacterium]|nr:hypothetical protein [Bdellovibrionales bacterium]